MENKRLADVGEFGLIKMLAKFAPAHTSIVRGIGDDAAVLPFKRDEFLLLTTDMLIEGVHFTKEMGAFKIGQKAMNCNVSDIAAMGGLPKWAVVSLGLPPDLKVDFVKNVYRGLNAAAKKFQTCVVGGDTNKSRKIVINVALIGAVKKNHLTLRRGAKIGDSIFVTGPLGRSLKGGKHLSFTPRIKESQFLVKHFLPNAMIDISDGLAGDLGHILEESKVGACLFEELIPRFQKSSLNEALFDGEDFELLFTLSSLKGQLLRQRKNFYCIGTIMSAKTGLQVITKTGRVKNITAKSFRHF